MNKQLQLSPYAIVGAKLIERGYCSIPARPGSKIPGVLVGGAWLPMPEWSKRYLSRLPSEREIEGWERAPGNPGICIVTGLASGCLVAIDADTEDAAEAMRRALPYTAARKRGQKGETSFYRGDMSKILSRSFNRPRPDLGKNCKERLVDVLAEGRQTIAPPSIHPSTGAPYRWIRERALEDMDPTELPELPDNALDLIAEALKPIGYAPDVERETIAGAAADAESPWRALNEHALANLDAWVPRLPLARLRKTSAGWEAVPDWRSSNTGRPVGVRKLNLKIHPEGIRDFGDTPGKYTAIDLVMKCGLASDITGAFGWLANETGWGAPVFHDPKIRMAPNHAGATIADGARGIVEAAGYSAGFLGDDELGGVIEKPLPPEIQACCAPLLRDGEVIDPETGEILSPLPVTSDQCAPDFADRILQEDGLVPTIARWILSAARRPQKRLAVAAAIGVVGTVASRQIVTPTRANTNLYFLMLAKTGNGKDAPLRAVKSILAASRLDCMIGPEGVGSDVALFDHVQSAPASIMPIDEFGDYIAAISGQRAAPHVLKIAAAMKTLWDGGLKKTAHSMSRPSVTLDNPCLSLICASTPAQFFDSVGQKHAQDGFLNRFLLINAPNKADRNDQNVDIEDVPDIITSEIAGLADRSGGMNTARFRLRMNEGAKLDKPFRVDWTDDTQSIWRDYEDEVMRRMEASPTQEAFAPRCANNALKIATILAISRDWVAPLVTRDLLETGIDLVETSLSDMVRGFENHLPESQTANLQDKILARIRQAGGTMKHRVLFRSMRRAFDRAASFDDLMKMLAATGQIEETREAPKNGGPPALTYRLLE